MASSTTAAAEVRAPEKSTAAHAPSALQHGLSDRVISLFQHASAIAEAEFAILGLSVVKILVLAVLSIPITLALTALGIYGFVLLDRAADIALTRPEFSMWLSPVVRGGVYFGLMCIGILPVVLGTLPAKSKA